MVRRTIAEPAAIHVVHVFGTLLPGGAERQALALVRHADAAQWRFSAINCCAAENALAPEFEAAGCPVHVLDKFAVSYPVFLRRLRDLIRSLAPDVVHTWLYAPGFWGRAAARWAKVPAIVASTRTGALYRHWYERVLDRWLSRRTATRIVNSRGVADNLVRHVGIRPEQLRVIYNGVDADRLTASGDRAALRRRLGWPLDAPVLLSVGRLVPEKNYPLMLRVVSRLRTRHAGLRWCVAGWGRLEGELRSQIAGLGLSDAVDLMGARDDVADLLHAADLFVMSSTSEGFSNALLEAMWVGLPAVSTRVNGAVEVIRSGENGVLVDVGDEVGLESAVNRLLGDAAARSALGAAARSDVRARFGVEKMVADHCEVYAAAAGASWRRRRGAAVRPLRILMLAHSNAPWTPHYARWFKRRGDAVVVLSFAPDMIDGVDVRCIGPRSFQPGENKRLYLTRGARIRRFSRFFEPDIVFAPYLISNGLAASVSGLTVPLVVSARGADVLSEQWGGSPRSHRVREAIVRTICAKAACVHTVSRELTERLRGLGVPAGKLVEFPVGTDTDRFRPAVDAPRSPATRLICTRKHEPIYDNETILEAIARLRADGHVVTIEFVGGGSGSASLKARAASLGIVGQVEFAGHVAHEQLPERLRAADVYVSASLSDGTSASLLEAMATGLLPVVSRITANESWIEHGRTGLMFTPRSVDELTDCLRRALDDDALRQAAFAANRERVLADGDMETNMRRLATLFEAIVAEARPS